MGSGLDRQKREKVLDTLSRCFVFSEVLVNDRNIPVCLGSFICLACRLLTYYHHQHRNKDRSTGTGELQ